METTFPTPADLGYGYEEDVGIFDHLPELAEAA